MPIGEDPNLGTPRKNLRAYIRQWEELRRKIMEAPDDIANADGTVTSNPEVDAWNEQRKEIVAEIQRIVEGHPKLRDEARDWGFTGQLPKRDENGGTDGSVDGDTGQGDGGGDGSGGGGTSGTSQDADPERNRNRDGQSKPGGHTYFLPGIKGKDFQVIRYNGRTYVSYAIKIKGNRINMTLRVPGDKLRAYGLSEGEGRQVTKKQFQTFNYFGSASDLQLHGDKRHPFKAFIEDVTAIYGGTGLLKNKEVMGTVLTAYAQNWSEERLTGALRQTKWAQKTTDYQQQWIFKSEAQQKSDIAAAKLSIQTSLKEMYGDNWIKYFPDHKNQIDKWAEKAAMGTLHAAGDPGKALEWFARSQLNKAERIEGTPAWVQRQQQLQADRDFRNKPEEAFEALRAQTNAALGYAGKDQSRLDNDTLNKWANRVASGRSSQADFDQYLRKTKQALFPWLDPDQNWTDFAAPFKSQAEQLMGQSLGWDDKLFMDFTKTNANGEPVKDGQVPISNYDFEKRVREDQRFWRGQVARDEGTGIVQLLQENLLGIR